MASRRKRKQRAQALGLTEAELQLCELLEEVLGALRWNQVLGWGNQYLLNQRLGLTARERDRVMRAAAETVEQDGQIDAWQRRLAEVKSKLQAIDTGLRTKGAAPVSAERPAVAGGGSPPGAAARPVPEVLSPPEEAADDA